MPAFVRASSGAGDPAKIQRWIRQWMDDGPSTGVGDKRDELRAVQLIHDADKSEVTSWQVNRKINIQTIARDIFERAKEDGQGLGDDRARYILQPYFGNSDMPNGRATFFIQVADPFPEGGDDGTGLTEGPTAKGMTTMLMRHTNDAVRLGLGGAAQSMSMLQEELERVTAECGVLRGELRDMGEKVRQYENESFERAIKWRKTLFWEKAREEILKQVIPFVGMAGGAVMTKIASLGGAPTGALPPARPQPAAPPTKVNVAVGAGFPVEPPAAATTQAPTPQAAPTAPPPSVTSEGKPTIEARLRRLYKALSLPQRIAFPMAIAKHKQLLPLQKAAGQSVVELLMKPGESPRAHPDAASLLEIQTAALFGTFTDKAFGELMDTLLQEANWTKEHVAIMVGIVRDLGQRDQAFDAAIAAPFPAPPEPVTPMDLSSNARGIMGPTSKTPQHAYDPVSRPAPAEPGTPIKAPASAAKASEKSSKKPASATGTKMPRLATKSVPKALPPRRK